MRTEVSPLVTMCQAQLEASKRCADAVLSGSERMNWIVIESLRRIVTSQLKFTQAMTDVRDPQKIVSALQSGFLAGSQNDAINDQKEIMKIFAEMQNEIGQSLQDYIEQISTHAAAPAPAVPRQQAASAAFNPMTNIFSVWESAVREAVTLAGKNMATAQSTLEETAKKTMEAAGTFTTTALDNASEGIGSAKHSTWGQGANGGETSMYKFPTKNKKSAPSSGKHK
jgi:hypothetical protein